ncbi:MAG: alpha/beta fold hydrolase [Planctomycetes bacterium]|nr:alpha/beta fold hydrolase [Planctomycetota bacterium]
MSPACPAGAVDLHFRERGRGFPLLLGHGLLLDGGMWDEVAERLSGRFRVVQVDLRGHGRSLGPPGGVTLEDMAADVARLADALDLETYAWAGLSMGGMVGMRLALRADGRLRALALLDTSAEEEPQRALFEAWAESQRGRPMGEPEVRAFLEMACGTSFLATAPPALARLGTQMARNDPEGVYQATRAVLSRRSVLGALGSLRLPVLVLVGAEDRLTPPSRSEAIRDAIPGAELEVVPGAAHLSAVEAPGAVAKALEGLLLRAGLR